MQRDFHGHADNRREAQDPPLQTGFPQALAEQDELQFPLMYQTDNLEVAYLLVGLGYRDERMEDALSIIASKQNERGQWNLEATFNGRYWVSIERKGTPSRWITYRALKVLKQFYG